MSRRVFPAVVSGYPLRGWRIAIIDPHRAENIANNPSLERAITGWAAAGSASVARTADQQRRGMYSLEVTPTAALTDGAYYGTVSLTAGTRYFAGIDVLGAGGVPYALYFADTTGGRQGPKRAFRGTGRWQRPVVMWQALTTGSYRVYVTKDSHASTARFHLDGLQVEAERATTYLDGDQRGLGRTGVEYYWTGTPHGSASVRAANTRAGGEVMDLTRYGFSLLALLGLGLGGFQNLTTENAFAGGSQYDGTIAVERVFDLAGAITGRAPGELDKLRADLAALLRPNRGIDQQPLVLRIQATDDCGSNIGEPVDIPCLFEGGLQGQRDNDYQERVALQFKTYLPYVGRLDGWEGAALDFQDSLANANYAIWQDADGEWHTFPSLTGGGGPIQGIFDVAVLPDGTWAIGGNFINAGGIADADFLARFDPATETFSAFNATPLNSSVNVIRVLPDGNALVGGNFTNAGGDANADYLTHLNLTTGAFTALNATPLNSAVASLTVLPDGDIAAGGNFTNAGGAADADYLCRVDGSTFAYSAFNATPLNNQVAATILDASGNYLIFGGDFTNAGADANADYVARLNLASGAYSALASTALNNAVDSLERGPDGSIYIGGIFTDGGGDPNGDRILRYNGTAFYAMSTGANSGVSRLLYRRNGLLLLGGAFTTIGNLTVNDLAGWNGSTFVYADITPPAATTIRGLAEDVAGNLIIGYDAAGTATVNAVTVVTNTGSADAHPVFEFTGPGTLYSIRNYTTGQAIYFDLTLLAGERAVLDLTPGALSFTSDFRGNILSAILPGSDYAAFVLTPGANNVSVFVAGTTDADTAATARWQPSYLALEDARY